MRSYTATYTPTVAGQYSTEISLRGGFLPASPVATVVQPAALHAPSCTAAGPGLLAAVAGQQQVFTVALRDSFGNLRVPSFSAVGGSEAGSISVVFDVADATVAAGSPLSLGDGRYSVAYTATVAQQVTVTVKVGGQPLNTTHTLTVQPAGSSAASSHVTAAGLEPNGTTVLLPVVAGTEAVFTVNLRDAYGNVVLSHRNGDAVAVAASLSSQSAPVNAPVGTAVPAADVQVVYAGSGNYRVSVTPSATGVYTVGVTLNGVALAAGPYSLTATDPATSVPDVAVQGGGLTAVVAGSFVSFSVTSYDSLGNVVDNAADAYEWVLRGARVTLQGTAARTGFGTYLIRWVLLLLPLFMSLLFCCCRCCFICCCFFFFSCCRCFYGRFLWVFIFFRSCRCFYCTVRLFTNLSRPCADCLACSYNASVAGIYTLDVTLGGSPLFLGATPQLVDVVPGTPVAATSTALGAGLSSAVAGAGTSFVLTARDVYGNDLRSSPVGVVTAAAVAAAPLGAGNTGPSVTPNTDGSYTVSYTFTKAQDVNISVSVGGVTAPHLQFSVTVQPAAVHAASCLLSPSSLPLPARLAGQASRFTILSYDQFGNRVYRQPAAAAAFVVGATGPANNPAVASATLTTGISSG